MRATVLTVGGGSSNYSGRHRGADPVVIHGLVGFDLSKGVENNRNDPRGKAYDDGVALACEDSETIHRMRNVIDTIYFDDGHSVTLDLEVELCDPRGVDDAVAVAEPWCYGEHRPCRLRICGGSSN